MFLVLVSSWGDSGAQMNIEKGQTLDSGQAKDVGTNRTPGRFIHSEGFLGFLATANRKACLCYNFLQKTTFWRQQHKWKECGFLMSKASKPFPCVACVMTCGTSHSL